MVFDATFVTIAFYFNLFLCCRLVFIRQRKIYMDFWNEKMYQFRNSL